MATPAARPIRSFVLRQGRTTPAQQRALDTLLSRYGISFPEKIESGKPLVLEIGSGMGETTIEIARAHPEIDFVAVEVHGPGVGSLLNRIEKEGLKNLRVVRHDAVEVLERMVADRSLAAVHLFFPDPWPKKRHHKRRLVQASFVVLIGKKLAAGGIVHAATDVPDYADHIERIFSESRDFETAKGGLVARPTTKFEARGLKRGHAIRNIWFKRR